MSYDEFNKRSLSHYLMAHDWISVLEADGHTNSLTRLDWTSPDGAKMKKRNKVIYV